MADLRIEKTRKALKRAFLELLEKESFENITVAELCDLAEVRCELPAFFTPKLSELA